MEAVCQGPSSLSPAGLAPDLISRGSVLESGDLNIGLSFGSMLAGHPLLYDRVISQSVRSNEMDRTKSLLDRVARLERVLLASDEPYFRFKDYSAVLGKVYLTVYMNVSNLYGSDRPFQYGQDPPDLDGNNWTKVVKEFEVISKEAKEAAQSLRQAMRTLTKTKAEIEKLVPVDYWSTSADSNDDGFWSVAAVATFLIQKGATGPGSVEDIFGKLEKKFPQIRRS